MQRKLNLKDKPIPADKFDSFNNKMVLFIEARYKFSDSEYENTKKLVSEILEKNKDQNILISGSIQYLNLVERLSKDLNLRMIPAHDHSCYDGQILGCSFFKTDENTIFINIVDGLFHSKILKINNPESIIYSINIMNNSYQEIIKDDIQKILNTKKAALTKFHYVKKIGVVVSQKPGQKIGDKDLKSLKQFLEKNEKDYQIFYSDNTNLNEFDNFNFIDYWINTACPRLSYDDAIEHNRLFAYYKDIMVNYDD